MRCHDCNDFGAPAEAAPLFERHEAFSVVQAVSDRGNEEGQRQAMTRTAVAGVSSDGL